jgi:hypothetical protein
VSLRVSTHDHNTCNTSLPIYYTLICKYVYRTMSFSIINFRNPVLNILTLNDFKWKWLELQSFKFLLSSTIS